jgi:hypothetical protein
MDWNTELNQLGSAMNQAISAIASKMGIAASHVYLILVRQMLIYGVLETAIGAALLVTGIVSLVHFVRFLKSDEADDGGTITLCVFGIIILFGVGIGLFADGLPLLINPEFAAIQWIVNMAAQVTH